MFGSDVAVLMCAYDLIIDTRYWMLESRFVCWCSRRCAHLCFFVCVCASMKPQIECKILLNKKPTITIECAASESNTFVIYCITLLVCSNLTTAAMFISISILLILRHYVYMCSFCTHRTSVH